MTSLTTRLLPPRFSKLPLAVLACTGLLAGCAVGPNFTQPDSELARAVLTPRMDRADDGVLLSSAVPSQWWLLFADPTLSALEQRAAAGNLDLQLAASRIEQSRAQLGIADAALLPEVGAAAGATREANSPHGKFAALGAPTRPSNFWQLGLDASWEIDLWGKARRAQEGSAATLEATIYEREAGRVSLAAEVARTYLQLRGTQAQLDIANRNLAVAERTLAIAESRERNGVATRFETTSTRSQLATSKSRLPELSRQRNALMNALALLLGEQPRALDAQLQTAMPTPALPAHVPVGVPSELARRRPDILRAEAQLHAATAAIGVAKADFYPRIGLKARLGVEAFESRDLASWDSRFFSVGPTVYLPIFQGGRLKQRLVLNEARQVAAALTYRQTVLRAWHEVDNALDAWAAQRQQHVELTQAYAQSEQALQVAERGYKEGAADFLSVLTAQRNALASQTSLNDSATNGTLALVGLYKALGGGWDAAVMQPHAAGDAEGLQTATAPLAMDSSDRTAP